MISVVAAVHNRAEDVRTWLKSLVNQTGVELEVILVNYSSTDGLEKALELKELTYKEVVVDPIPGVEGFPEARLKNIGIKVASGDIVVATNVDLIYSSIFFSQIESCCADGFLVQAMRINAPRGSSVTTEGDIIKANESDQTSTVNDYCEWGIPIVTGGDCQAMRKRHWHDMHGYDEELYGWGALDTDMVCRGLQAGLNLLILSATFVKYVHKWHPVDRDRNREDAKRNHEIIVEKVSKGAVVRNLEGWGELPQREEVT